MFEKPSLPERPVVDEITQKLYSPEPPPLPASQKVQAAESLFRWLVISIIVVTCLLWLRDIANFYFIAAVLTFLSVAIISKTIRAISNLD